jgi:hypothetical protein
VYTGDDVSGNQAVTHALAGIGAGANSSVHSAGFSAHQHGYVATAYELTANQTNFSSLGHSISRFYRGDQTAGFNHAKGNTHNFSHFITPSSNKIKKNQNSCFTNHQGAYSHALPT